MSSAAPLAGLVSAVRVRALFSAATDLTRTPLCLPQEALGVPPFLRFESCSERVGKVLGADVMKSVADLVPDLLAALPMLLFQGAPGGGENAEGCALACLLPLRPWQCNAALHP